MDVVESQNGHLPPGAIADGHQPALYLGRRLYNAVLMLVGDTVGLCLAFLVASGGHLWWTGSVPIVGGWSIYVVVAWSIGAVLLGLLPSWGLGPIIELRRISSLLVTIFGSAALISLLVGPRPPDAAILTGALLVAGVAVPLLRLRAKRFLIAKKKWGIPAAIYGAGKTGRQIVSLLQKEQGIGYHPVVMFDDASEMWHGTTEEDLFSEEGPLVTQGAPIAIVAQPDIGDRRLKQLIEDSLSQYQTVLIIPELEETPSLWARSRDISGVIGLEIPCNLARTSPRLFKRVTDLALTALSVPLWGPFCLGIAGLIWLEDQESPLFFQKRVGQNGAPFWTWKFRTMVPNAEAVLQRRLAEDDALREEWDHNFKLQDDPRLTTVGRWLRTFSLDELPQLVNVLRGEMSLVGPRPLPQYHVEELPASVQALRERVRPGMTGLWQVSGRSKTGTAGMEQWDPYYVRNWSLWLDVVVLFRTLRAVIERKGAY